MTAIKGLKLQGATYYVNVVVPIDVRHAFPTKSIWKTTGTGDPRDAAKIGERLRSEIKKQIAEARRLAVAPPPGRDRILRARIALADWATSEAQRIIPTGVGINPDWVTLARADALQKAVDDADGYKAIAGFDQFLAEQLTAHDCPVGIDDPLVADMRREAALIFVYAIKFAERGRQANAFLQRAREVALSDR